MLYSCPNHELSRDMIIQKIYARLSLNDTSCAGSYMLKTIEFKWDLLGRIKHNSEDWDSDDGKKSGMTLKFDCVKSFIDTDAFRGFSTKYGLDSEIVASFYESSATHIDLPKEKWFKRIMLKLRLLFVRVILGLIHLLSKSMLNLVLLWLNIS